MENAENIEWAFLWSVIHDIELLKETQLTADHFFESKTKAIFKVFNALVENWNDITPILFGDYIKRHNTWLEVIDFITASQSCESFILWKQYEESILNSFMNRKLKQIKHRMTLDNLADWIDELKTIRKSDNLWTWIIELTNCFEDFRSKVQDINGLWYAWPYKVIDKYTGGIIPWKVYCIVAYSGVWKSNFSYSYITDALKKGRKVLCFSLEVQKEMLFNSLLKSYYNINQKQILDKDFCFELWDFENLTVCDDIYNMDKIESVVRARQPDIVVIDFIQNIETKWWTEYERITNIARRIQRLAIETNATIFSISQANNDSRFKNSENIQPKGSGAIFESSDIIIWLSKDGEWLSACIIKNKYWMSGKSFMVDANFRNIQFKVSHEIGGRTDDTDFNF